MKYNTLLEYKKALVTGGLSSSTALTYYNAVCYLLEGQYLFDCKEMNIDTVLNKLRAFKYKGEYSKYKNAFVKLCDFLDIKLSADIISELDSMIVSKKKKYRKLKAVRLADIQNQIKIMKDKKLRLSYETLLSTGLRVSELSQIKRENCVVFDSEIELSFIGKGGKQEQVFVYKNNDESFFYDLCEHITSHGIDEKIFYSSSYLQAKAHDKGFSCHDLRRAYAKIIFRDCKDINTVKQLLRHSKIKNTRLYLKSKVEI